MIDARSLHASVRAIASPTGAPGMTLTPQMQALRAKQQSPVAHFLGEVYRAGGFAAHATMDAESAPIFAMFREVYDKASADEQGLMRSFISDAMLDAMSFCCRASWSSIPMARNASTTDESKSPGRKNPPSTPVNSWEMKR